MAISSTEHCLCYSDGSSVCTDKNSNISDLICKSAVNHSQCLDGQGGTNAPIYVTRSAQLLHLFTADGAACRADLDLIEFFSAEIAFSLVLRMLE